MIPKFDIFRIETDGGVRWLAAVPTLDEARTLAQQLLPQARNGLIILDLKTGTRYTVDPSALPEGAIREEATNDRAPA